jgi:hypothetical protein
MSPLSGMSPRPSTLAASQLPAAAQQLSPPKPALAFNMAHADEVLRLDDSSESEPNSPQGQHVHVAHSPRINAASSPQQQQQQQGSRPASASKYQGEGSGRSSSSAYTAKACRFKAELQEQLRCAETGCGWGRMFGWGLGCRWHG